MTAVTTTATTTTGGLEAMAEDPGTTGEVPIAVHVLAWVRGRTMTGLARDHAQVGIRGGQAWRLRAADDLLF